MNLLKFYNKKKIFIFGGSSGIGLSAAALCLSYGADVVIFSRDKDKLSTASRSLAKAKLNNSTSIASCQADASDHFELQHIFESAVEIYGIPDIVINCIGKARPEYFEKISHNQFIDTLNTNLTSSWNIASLAVRYLKKNGGQIAFVSSVGGFIGVFGYADYSASKFAIMGMAEVLKSEVKKYGINISVLCPPDTRTPGFDLENINKPLETKNISKNAKLLEPDFVALNLLKGICKRKFIIIPGFEARLSYVIKRYFPGLIDLIISNSISKT